MGEVQTCGEAGELDPRWLDVLRESLGHQPYMLVARDHGMNGDIRGYLPVTLVRSRLFGRFLVSLPYLNRAGLVADDEQIAGSLVREAVNLGDRLGVQYVELRHGEPISHDALPRRRDEKVRMVLDLPDSDEALWEVLTAKVRNQVRKGEKQGLSIRWGGVSMVGDFYRVFCVNMRDLGAPAYTRRLFDTILTRFDDRAELAVVDYGGRPVAAALLVHAETCTQVPSAGSLRRYHGSCANMWMYHQLLQRAIQRRARQFDFARSSVGSGTYRFKKQWGAEPHPTVWQYHVRFGDVESMRPESQRFRKHSARWQKMPVWLTRLIGPAIVRGIP